MQTFPSTELFPKIKTSQDQPGPEYYPLSGSNTRDNNYAEGIGGTGASGTRLPSPTPSETRVLEHGLINRKAFGHWRFWFRKEWKWYYLALVIIIVVSILLTVYHKQIVAWLTPVAERIREQPAGWLVPIAILFIISFPPLFGHEIVGVLCGLIWGLGVGFAILAAGTFLGEVGNFYAFKYCCRARGEKLEKTQIRYACLARAIRDGGWIIALVARYSAIPGHFTTAVFSTCGMSIWVFSVAAILSLPKQFIIVYTGYLLGGESTTGESPPSKIVTDVVLALTIIITVGAMWYIMRAMNKVKNEVIMDRRKARMTKAYMRAEYTSTDWQTNSTVDLLAQTRRENEAYDQTDIPMAPRSGSQNRYSSSSSNTLVHAPQPRHAPKEFITSVNTIEHMSQKEGKFLNVDRDQDMSPKSDIAAYTPRMMLPGLPADTNHAMEPKWDVSPPGLGGNGSSGRSPDCS